MFISGILSPIVTKPPNPDSCAQCQSLSHQVWSRESLIIRRAAQWEGRGPFPSLPCPIGPRDRLYTLGKRMWRLGQKLEGPWNFLKLCTKSIFLAPPGGPDVVHVDFTSSISSPTLMLSAISPGPVTSFRDEDKGETKWMILARSYSV